MKTGKIVAVFSLFIICSSLFSFGFNTDSKQRIRYTINKNDWKFKREEVKNGFKASLQTTDWQNISIPHDYNGGSDGINNDVFQGRFDAKNDINKRMMYTGPGWYRATFSIEEQYKGKRIFIEFEGVSLEAKVWINGKEVGIHRGGYTAFSFDITDFIQYGKLNILAVRADNTNNPKIAPWMADEKRAFPFSFDYAVYGGIYRDVWISITDPVKIEKVFNTPVIGGQAPASVSIDTKVKNYSKKSQEVELITEIFDPANNNISTLKSKKSILPGEIAAFSQIESTLGNVKLWDVKNPTIYNVHSTISYNGKVVDEFESVFGFRYYTFANNQAFVLNDNKLLIRGVNRHQDMEGLGYALPNKQHWADARLIKDAGFNFVRHAHYPADPEFTKACNQLGLMLWLEIPLTGSTSDNPSVIVWGIGNESDRSGASETVINHVFSELVKLSKELDQNRPVTGCNFKFESSQKIVDAYSPQDWNGWYNAEIVKYKPTNVIGEYGADMHYPYHSDQKFDINTNYGAGGRPDFWSQEYGCWMLEYKVAYGESHADQFPGHFVWIAFDFASPRVDRGKNPIPYMNQKGLVLHDHKTKKDAYYFYQSTFRTADDYPMVYIVSHSWTDRWSEPAKKDVWVYSNCDSVQLYNDYGKIPLGTRIKNSGPSGNTRFQWNEADVKYNVLYAEGWYKNQVVARDTIILKNLPSIK
jgi:beta-galactosidase